MLRAQRIWAAQRKTREILSAEEPERAGRDVLRLLPPS